VGQLSLSSARALWSVATEHLSQRKAVDLSDLACDWTYPDFEYLGMGAFGDRALWNV
jgi:hypothetical protein